MGRREKGRTLTDLVLLSEGLQGHLLEQDVEGHDGTILESSESMIEREGQLLFCGLSRLIHPTWSQVLGSMGFSPQVTECDGGFQDLPR